MNAKKNDKKPEAKTSKIDERVVALEKKLAEQEDMTKKAQHDYINLKYDFDRRQRQYESEKQTAKVNALVESVKKLLPFVDDLRKSLENIPTDQKDNPLSKWVELTYNKFLRTLEELHIYQIEAVGKEPDTNLHEPVSVQPTDDKKLKGKIVAEFERGFMYKKDNTHKVITTSKVVVWQ